MTVTDVTVDVRCWRCGKLLFKLDAGSTGKLEHECGRCKARNVVPLDSVR